MPEPVTIQESSGPQAMPALVRFKLEVMHLIVDELRQRYRWAKEAALAAGVGGDVLSRLRHRRHDRFSVPMLFEIADRVGVPMRIHITRRSKRNQNIGRKVANNCQNQLAVSDKDITA